MSVVSGRARAFARQKSCVLRAKSGQEKTPTLDLDSDILADTDAPAIEAFLKSKGVIS